MLDLEGGKLRMPKQEVNEGQVHGYIGEKEGLVETYDAKPAGSTNVVPDPETAQRRVEAAQAALDAANASLKAATAGQKSAAKSDDKQRGQSDNK